MPHTPNKEWMIKFLGKYDPYLQGEFYDKEDTNLGDEMLKDIQALLDSKESEVWRKAGEMVGELKAHMIKKGDIIADESSMTWRVLNDLSRLFTSKLSTPKDE